MTQTVSNETTPSVLLISVDALKPEFVFEQERLGVPLPSEHDHRHQSGNP